MFINSLVVQIKSENIENLDDFLLKIEENNLWFSFEVNDKNSELAFFKEAFIWDNSVWFKNYMEIGAFIKELLIEKWFANKENYKDFFSIKKIDLSEKKEEKKELFEVPDNDKKLLEAMAFLKKVGKD